MKVLELKGYKSLKALNAFHALMLGIKMLPAYLHESYEDFYLKVSGFTDEGKQRIIREAALFVELQKDEVEALAGFCADANGVPYSPENMKSLRPDELIEIIVSVCFEISKINIGLLSESEKKKLVSVPLM